MGLLELLTVRKNTLRQDEREAAKILYNIFIGYKMRDAEYLAEGIGNLSINLYYLTFRMLNKKFVKLEDLAKPLSFKDNPKELRYIELYSFIRESVTEMCDNPVVNEPISLNDCETSIHILLHIAASKLKAI